MQGQSPAQPDHSSLLVLAFSPLETTSGTEVQQFFGKLRSWNFCSLAVPFRTNMVKGVGIYYKLIIPKKTQSIYIEKKTRFKSEPS